MDGYFDLAAEDAPANESLLEGIVSSLHDAALDAFAAVDTLWSTMWNPWLNGQESVQQQWKDEIRSRFVEFSQADIEPGAKDGLQGIIDDLGRIRETLQRDSKVELQQAHDMLGEWRGDAANQTKYYVLNLTEEYEIVESKLSILQSDVVAAREMIAKGRSDLRNLSGSFRDAADQYRQAEQANARGNSEVLTDAFTGAIAGLLAVPTGGASLLAAGAVIAGSAAGSVVVGEITHKPLEGDKPEDIYQDFLDAIDDIKTELGRTGEKLVHDINALEMPELQDPPDVSPGRSFNPDNFGTNDIPPETERNVRDSGKDIPRYKPGDRQREREAADDNVAKPFS
ncbi:hypothetical protein HFP15_40610 [Amycolatopsis sp. K13G38]|uniref:WXG100 family type VII secretion target n=1 Tax=Amycolatopsis acididurans TaxID=2724524 RepID=A0ABX1JHE9_9PSEU|nr:hypothetical protein [Amycolatopsis acididurans]NKQ59163.1 hypothetical protein [Amycolatopsis acididurans]